MMMMMMITYDHKVEAGDEEERAKNGHHHMISHVGGFQDVSRTPVFSFGMSNWEGNYYCFLQVSNSFEP
jgi:hypothetical protein